MNLRAKTVLSLSMALPLLALAAFLLVPPPAWAQSRSATDVVGRAQNCIYAGLEYSPGATIQGACPTGEVQTCQNDGSWTPCKKPSAGVGVGE
jgi:hypothetical protein